MLNFKSMRKESKKVLVLAGLCWGELRNRRNRMKSKIGGLLLGLFVMALASSPSTANAVVIWQFSFDSGNVTGSFTTTGTYLNFVPQTVTLLTLDSVKIGGSETLGMGFYAGGDPTTPLTGFSTIEYNGVISATGPMSGFGFSADGTNSPPRLLIGPVEGQGILQDSDNDPFISDTSGNLSLDAVAPEPTSALLLLLGAIGVVMRRQKQRPV
jgi:hypothetical protein